MERELIKKEKETMELNMKIKGIESSTQDALKSKIKEMMNKKVTMNKIKVPATKSDSMIELNYTSQRADTVKPS